MEILFYNRYLTSKIKEQKIIFEKADEQALKKLNFNIVFYPSKSSENILKPAKKKDKRTQCCQWFLLSFIWLIVFFLQD